MPSARIGAPVQDAQPPRWDVLKRVNTESLVVARQRGPRDGKAGPDAGGGRQPAGGSGAAGAPAHAGPHAQHEPETAEC
jgi:hypothetical protein